MNESFISYNFTWEKNWHHTYWLSHMSIGNKLTLKLKNLLPKFKCIPFAFLANPNTVFQSSFDDKICFHDERYDPLISQQLKCDAILRFLPPLCGHWCFKMDWSHLNMIVSLNEIDLLQNRHLIVQTLVMTCEELWFIL